MTQARAFVSGRDYAIPEDVKAVAVPALAHRLALDTKAKYSGVQKEDVVREILGRSAGRESDLALRPDVVRRAVLGTPFLDALVYFYEERLTARGRYLLWMTAVFALLGLDTRRSQVFLLFAAAAGLLIVACVFTAWPRAARRPRVPAARSRPPRARR